MASISTDPNGNRTIQFVAGDGKRRSIRLGSVNKKVTESIKLRIEHLNAMSIAKLPMDGETAQWVATIGDELAGKLAAVGLIPERQSEKLGAFLDAYLELRKADVKGGTATNIRQVATDLTRHFGADRPLRDVTVAMADGFKAHMLTRLPKLAADTVHRRLKRVRQLFDYAVRVKLIADNPFRDVAAASALPEKRRYYVSEADILRVIAACNPTWRSIVALARFGGLRTPSETLLLKWEHVDFTARRMSIPSPKTEHIPGKACRVVPIFATLRPYLAEAFKLAAPGEVYVVGGSQGDRYRQSSQGPNGWVNSNLRTPFAKLIRRAGLELWPRLFHNLRSSCETDLLAEFPVHVVCGWLGNSPAIALKHYAQTLDRDFERAAKGGAESGAVAVQNAVQSKDDTMVQEKTETPETLTVEGFRRLVSDPARLCSDDSLTLSGFEPEFWP